MKYCIIHEKKVEFTYFYYAQDVFSKNKLTGIPTSKLVTCTGWFFFAGNW